MKTQPTADMLSRHALEFWEAVDYFHRNRLKIRKRYKQDFVAILDDAVVDSDEDYSSLVTRCRERMADRDPYIGYASALSREEMREQFNIENAADALDGSAWEEFAAREFMKRFQSK